VLSSSTVCIAIHTLLDSIRQFSRVPLGATAMAMDLFFLAITIIYCKSEKTMSTAAAEALTPPAVAPPLPPVPPPPAAAAAEEPPRPTAAPPVPPPQAEAQVTEETDSAVSVSELRAYKGSTLEKTGKFEDLRKAHFTTLYDNNSLYWQSFVELIKRNQTRYIQVSNVGSAIISYIKILYCFVRIKAQL
jgi:hypothetical protein